MLCHARFRPTKAREIIAAVLRSRLAGSSYNADKASAACRDIADEIKQRLKGGCLSKLHVICAPLQVLHLVLADQLCAI